MKTLDQQIAFAQDKVSRLRAKKKASDTRVKIIVGAVVTKAAFESPDAAAKLAGLLRANVTRDLDVKEIQPLLADLDRKAVGRQGGGAAAAGAPGTAGDGHGAGGSGADGMGNGDRDGGAA